LPISLFQAMQPPVSIELFVCRVFSANTIVEDADGNNVRACVKAANTIVEDADGNNVRACVKGGQASGCMHVARDGGFQ
jgi:hypothetical protein